MGLYSQALCPGLLPYPGSTGGDPEGPQGGLQALAMGPLELAPRPLLGP